MIQTETLRPRILIIDDEAFVRDILADILQEDYTCCKSSSAEEALEILEQQDFDLVLSDIRMRGMSGLEMIPKVLATSPDTVVMTISGEGNIDSAIEAMQAGTFDYIKKPFELDQIRMSVERALRHRQLLIEKRRYENHLEELVEQRTRELNYLAFYDSLTNLPNRTLFEDRLAQSMQVAARHGRQLGLVFLSLDRFRKLQATLGHDFGFQVLREVAARFQTVVPAGATIARFENDHFAILLPSINETKPIVRLIERIREVLQPAVIIDDQELFVSASFGVSLCPSDGTDGATLQKNAAVALSRARERADGNGCEFFAEEMNSIARRRLDLEVKLRHALEREEFEVYYQPKKDFCDDRIVGMEALVRWNHPELGLVSPAEFIPLAEETGLIIPIGEWILETACEEAKHLSRNGRRLCVSVNISTRQLEDEALPAKVSRIINQIGIDPRLLELEVTESALLNNTAKAVEILNQIKEFGVRIAIDDFGTGYSSLGYLKKLPIDVLKIDRSFVADITTDQNDASLVMAIISLAHNLRLRVIAEGVETEEQLQLLHLLRCDEWQGYLFSKPVPAEEFRELLNR